MRIAQPCRRLWKIYGSGAIRYSSFLAQMPDASHSWIVNKMFWHLGACLNTYNTKHKIVIYWLWYTLCAYPNKQFHLRAMHTLWWSQFKSVCLMVFECKVVWINACSVGELPRNVGKIRHLLNCFKIISVKSMCKHNIFINLGCWRLRYLIGQRKIALKFSKLLLLL